MRRYTRGVPLPFIAKHSLTGLFRPGTLAGLALGLCTGLQTSCTTPINPGGQGKETGGSTGGGPSANTPTRSGSGSGPGKQGGADTSASTGTTPRSKGEPCASDLDCDDPNRPACDPQSGTCVRCTQSADHCTDPKAPICGRVNGVPSCQACFADDDCRTSKRGNYCLSEQGADGQSPHRCVECTSDESCSDPNRPYCDLQAGRYQCTACNTVLGQCPGDQSCLLLGEGTGRCTQAVIYAQESSDCEDKTGSKDSPFCTLMDAIQAVDKDTPTTIRLPRGDSTMIGLQVPAGIKVSIVGQEDFAPQLMLDKGTELSIHGVRMKGGLLIGGGSKVRLSALESARSGAIALTGQSELWMERSVFASDASPLGAAPILLEDSTMHIASSVLAGHKVDSDDPERDGLALFGLKGNSKLLMDHVTIANNDLERKAPLFRCKDRRSSITIENSIVLDLGTSSQLRCANAQISAKRVLSDLPLLIKNQGQLWTPTKLDGYFRNPAINDFGLGPGYFNSADPMRKAIRELGEWTVEQSPWDLDGEPWAPGKGYVGADQAES